MIIFKDTRMSNYVLTMFPLHSISIPNQTTHFPKCDQVKTHICTTSLGL